jgi:hypothetical protein
MQLTKCLQVTFCPSQDTAEGASQDACEYDADSAGKACHKTSRVRANQDLAVADGTCCDKHQPARILRHTRNTESVETGLK